MNKIIQRSLIVVLFASATANLTFAQSDKDDVLAAVQQFFDGMAEADSVASRQVLMENGQFYATSMQGESVRARQNNFEDYLARIRTNTDDYLERMWDAEVQVSKWLAVVTTPYDFYINGEFSHCGTDVFNLIKTDEGWKISSAMYTVERTGCPPSPLGEPK